MSSIRPQLDQAKHEYHLVTYPGDLASEVLSMRIGAGMTLNEVQADQGYQAMGGAGASKQRWWWAGTGSAAAAAVVAFGFYLSQRNPVVPGAGGLNTGPGVAVTTTDSERLASRGLGVASGSILNASSAGAGGAAGFPLLLRMSPNFGNGNVPAVVSSGSSAGGNMGAGLGGPFGGHGQFAPAIGQDEYSTFLIGSRPSGEGASTRESEPKVARSSGPVFRLDPNLPLHPAPRSPFAPEPDPNTESVDYTRTPR